MVGYMSRRSIADTCWVTPFANLDLVVKKKKSHSPLSWFGNVRSRTSVLPQISLKNGALSMCRCSSYLIKKQRLNLCSLCLVCIFILLCFFFCFFQEQDIHGVSVKNYTESIIEEVERISKEHQNDTKPIIVVIGEHKIIVLRNFNSFLLHN